MIDSILKTAGNDGAAQTVRPKKLRIYYFYRFHFRPTHSYDLTEVTVVVTTRGRFRRLAELRNWNLNKFKVLDCGPFIVALQVLDQVID